MFQIITKLFAIMFLAIACSSVPLNSAFRSVDKHASADKTPPLKINQWEGLHKLQEYTKPKKYIPSSIDLFDKSGKSKVWTNFQHVQPFKRSGDSLLDSVSNPSFQNKVVDLNRSNAQTNYPINLMYANNLTVKNYFLMMPPCNGSSSNKAEEQMEKLDERLESKDNPELSVNAQQQSASETNLSSVFTKGSTFETQEVSTGNASSSDNVSSSYSTNDTKETTSSMETMNSTDSELPNTTDVYFQWNVSSSNETVNSTVNNTAENLTNLSEEITNTTLNSLITFFSITNEKTEELVTTTNQVETISSTSISNETSINGNNVVIAQQETVLSTTSSSQPPPPLIEEPSTSTTSTTLIPTTCDDKASRFFQTINKYCETFAMEDKGTYTIHPVPCGLNDHLVGIVPEKPNAKEKISSLKDKRFLVKQTPRKNVKQLFNTDHLDYPL